MSDRHFYSAACPFCRQVVFQSPGPGPIINRDGRPFSIVATAKDNLVEVVAHRGPVEHPLVDQDRHRGAGGNFSNRLHRPEPN